MSASKFAGKNFLLKVGNDASPTVFTTVAAQRTTSLSINQETIDVTDKDDSRWRKLLEGGVRDMSLSAAGLISDAAAFTTLRNIAMNGYIKEYQVQFGNGMSFTGRFQLTSVELSGEYTDAQQYSVSLASAGDIGSAG